MDWAIDFVLRHNYLVLFLFVFVEQNGLPVPALPILIAAGALSASGKISAPIAFLTAMAACLTANTVWYFLGRRSGSSILKLICRISLKPDSCVRTTESMFETHGAFSLVYAKFIPGLAIITPPLAGLFRLGLGRFLVLDTLGSALWTGAFLGIGYLFDEQLELIAIPALKLGGWLILLLPGSLGVYILWKYLDRRKSARNPQVERILPEELAQKVSSDGGIVVLDLRHSVEGQEDQDHAPAAIRVSPERVQEHIRNLPKDREIVLFCT
jgi:membrane protein DedA with SNARE-associated domain